MRQVRHGRLLDGADHVVTQIQSLQTLKTDESDIADTLNTVARQPQHLELSQVLERGLGVLDGVRQLVVVKVEFFQKRNLGKRVLGINMRYQIVLQIEKLQTW